MNFAAVEDLGAVSCFLATFAQGAGTSASSLLLDQVVSCERDEHCEESCVQRKEADTEVLRCEVDTTVALIVIEACKLLRPAPLHIIYN